MSYRFIVAGYRALKAMIRADPWLAIQPSGDPNRANGIRRFVWFDEDKPWPDRPGSPKAPADLIELTLDYATSRRLAGRDAAPTFGGRYGSDCAYVGTKVCEYEIALVAGDVRITVLGEVIDRVEQALYAFPTVDVGGVGIARVGEITCRNERTVREPAGGTYRRIARMRVPVTVTFRG